MAYSSVILYKTMGYLNYLKFKDFFFFKKKIKRYTLFLVVLALLLGSLWSQEELNWGGWWNWDPIELGLLFFLAYALLSVHKYFKFKNFFFIFFLFFFLGIRYEFFNSIHNFLFDVTILSYSYLFVLAVFIVNWLYFLSLRNVNAYLFVICIIFFIEYLKTIELEINVNYYIYILIYVWLIQVSYTNIVHNLIFPLPIFMLFYLYSNKKIHFFIFLFIIIIFFFKSTFYELSIDVNIFDKFIYLNEYIYVAYSYWYNYVIIRINFFFFNLGTYNTYVDAYNIFFLEKFNNLLEYLQQNLIFLNLNIFSAVGAYLLVSLLASFSLLVLLL